MPYFVTINAYLANYWRSTSCPVEHAKTKYSSTNSIIFDLSPISLIDGNTESS